MVVLAGRGSEEEKTRTTSRGGLEGEKTAVLIDRGKSLVKG